MKRKNEETLNLPSSKKVKLDPKSTVLNLLEQHKSQLTIAHLKNVLQELTIEMTHDLLILLMDQKKLEKPGANSLKQILFSHLFAMNYEDTGLSLQNLHELLFEYNKIKSLPRFQGRQLNLWLSKVNCHSSQVKNFPFILKIIEVLALGNSIDYFNQLDALDLALINKRLSAFVEIISTETKNIITHIYWIIDALGHITMRECKDALETSCIDEMLSFFLNESPKTSEMNQTLYNIANMLSRHSFKKIISVTWVENALLYMNKHADIEPLFKRMIQLSKVFCTMKYVPRPLEAKALQPIIDRLNEGNPTTDQLLARMNSISALVAKQLVHGSIEGMDIFLEQFNEKELTSGNIHEFFYFISTLAPALENPWPVHCVEKFLIPKILLPSMRHLSLALNTIFILADKSQLSGQFSGNFLPFIDFVADSTIENLDEKMVVSALSAYGACLLRENIRPDQSQIINKLLRHLIQLKIMETSSLVHAFNAFKNIAISKKFKGMFRGEDMILLFEKFRNLQTTNAHVAICSYNLGIIARHGYLEGTVSQKILNDALKTLLRFPYINPTVLFKCLIAFADLKAQNSLHDPEREQETILDELISHTRIFGNLSQTEKIILRELNVSDVEVVLNLPYQLRAKTLNIIMPLCLYMLHCNPEIKAIKAINRAIDEQIKTKSLARMPVKFIGYFFIIHSKLNQFYPITFLNTLILVGNLLEENLLEGELTLTHTWQYIQKIFNEDLLCQPQMTAELSYIAKLLDNINFLCDNIPVKLDILPAIFKLIARNLDETKVPDLESVAFIFQSMQNLLDAERIVFTSIKDQILAEILQSVIKSSALQNDHCFLILEGLCCLVDYQLIEGHVDATIINNFLAKVRDLAPEGLDKKLPDILLEYNQSYSKNPKPGLIPQQMFYHNSEEKPSVPAGLSPNQYN